MYIPKIKTKYATLMLAGLFLLFSAVYVNAASMLNFSGKITDTSGSELADGVYDMNFRIYDAQVGGNILWSEDLTAANRFGGIISNVTGQVYTYDSEHATTTLRVGQYLYNASTSEAVLIVDFDLSSQTITVASGSPFWIVGQAINNRSFVEGGIINENLGSVTEIDIDFSQTRYLELEFNGEVMEPRKILDTAANAFNAERLGGEAVSSYANVNNDLSVFGQWNFENILNVSTSSTSTALTVNQDGTGDLVRLTRGTSTLFAVLNNGQVLFKNYSFPINDGNVGYVLKSNGAGVVSWQADLTSNVGSSWATNGDSSIIYPADTAQIVVVGSNATSSSGYQFEVRNGDALFEGVHISNDLLVEGLITNGTWNGAMISNAYIASSSIWNSAYNEIAASSSQWQAGYNYRLTSASGEFNLSNNQLVINASYNIPLTASTSQWVTAFGWGNHTLAGYLINTNNLSDLNSSSTARANLGLAIGTNVQDYDSDLSQLGGFGGSINKIIYLNGAGVYSMADFTTIASNLMDDADALAMRTTLGLGTMSTLNNTGSTTITVLGTVTTGEWQGDIVGVAYGGTGTSTIQAGYLLMGNGNGGYNLVASTTLGSTPALSGLTDVNISGVQNGQLIRWDSVTSRWINISTSSLNIDLGNTTGTLSVNRGGTGQISWTQGGLLFATTTNELSQIENGQAGYALTWDNILGHPTWSSTTVATAHDLFSGQHSDMNLSATITRGGMLTRNATNDQWTTIVAGNQNQILTMNASGDPTWASTTNITELGVITNGTWNGTPVNSLYIASSTEWGNAYTIVMASSTNWNSVYNIVNASSTYWDTVYTLVNNNNANWDTAYGWGNHAAQTYFATSSGPLAIDYGGTGKSTWTSGGILWASSTNEISQIATGTNGYALTWGTNGPTWSSTTAATAHELFSAQHNDTNINGSLTVGDLMFRNASNQWQNMAAGSVGNILWVNSSNLPEWQATSSLGFATTGHDHNSVYLQLANNLSDLSSSSTARTNLGLATVYTNQDYMINSTGNIDEVWMGNGAGWTATSSLGLLSLNAIDMGTTGYIPYYSSSARQLTATSTIYIDTNTNVGIGTTTNLTKKLSVSGGAEFDQICIGASCITGWAETGAINISGTPNDGDVTYWSNGNTLASEAQLSVSRGGTGRATYSPGSLLYASSTNEIGEIATSSDGWALVMQNGIPTWASTSPGTAHSLLGNAQHSDTSGEVAEDGDLLIHTDGKWGRLAKQNDNQYLVLQAGLPTWASTTNITELGTITNGIWNGTVINSTYIASSSIWNAITNLVNASSSNWTNTYNTVTASSSEWQSGYTYRLTSVSGEFTLTNNQLAINTDYNIPLTASTTNWQSAYLWGNHNTAGYLTNITNQSIGDLADVVATSTLSSNDLMRWNGTAWVGYADSNYSNSGHNHSGVYQTVSSALGSIAGLVTLADQMLYTIAPNMYATTSLTTYARQILDDVDASAMRTTLELGTMALIPNTGSSTITTLGTITNGTWQAGTIAVAYGGTGTSTSPNGGYLLMGNGSGGYTFVASTSLGSAGNLETLGDVNISTKTIGDILYYDGANWKDISTSSLGIAIANTTGILSTNRGGTNWDSSGQSGIAIINGGIWGTSSTLPTTMGGTGKITWTQGGLLFATTTDELAQIENGSNGYALTWNTVLGRPVWASTTVATAHDLFSGQHSDMNLSATITRGGMLVRNATNNQWTTIVAGNQNQILTMDGNGDPIWASTTNITELGIITNGTWQGSPINSLYIASSTEWGNAYTIVMASSTNWNSVYNLVNASSTYWDTAYTLVNNNNANWNTAYGWGNHAAQTYFATSSGPLAIDYGGTGKSTWTSGGILWASSTNEISQIATGTNGYALTWGTNGPTWSSTTAATAHEFFSAQHSDMNIDGSLVAGDLMFRNASNQWQNMGIGTVGQILWVNGSNLPEWQATSSLGFATTGHDHNSTYLQLANNLSDLSSSSTARTNLGLATVYTNQDYMINSTGNIDEVWMGNGAGWTATSSLGLLSLNAIDMGTTGYIPYYSSSARQLTATSTIYIDTNTNVGIGTTTNLTKKLSVSGGAEFDQICIGTSCITNWSTAGAIDGSGATNAIAYWSDANTLTYEAILSVSRGGTGRATYSSGSLLYASSTNEIGEIATSSEGWALVMQNGIPTWASTSPGTTHTLLGNAQHSDTSGEAAQDGDLIIRDGGTWKRLAKQNDNQYLVLQAGLPTWASTTNITELGTVTTGLWNGAMISNAYIASSSVWNNAYDAVTASSSEWQSGYTYRLISASGEFTLSNNTLAIDSNYNIPLTASTTNWQNAYLWGDHNTAGYLTNITNQSIGSLMDVAATSTLLSNDLMRWDGAAWVGYADSNYATSGHNHSGVYQTVSPALSSIAGLVTLADQMLYTTGADTYATTTLTAFARQILDDADAGTMRTTLGLGSMAILNNTGSTTIAVLGTITTGKWQGDIVAVAYGGTGTSTVQAGYVLMGNGSGGYDFVASSTMGSIPALSGLSDVNISGIQNGQLIRWDSNSSMWVNISTSSLKIALGDTTGILAVDRGGTGKSSYGIGSLLYASSTNEIGEIASSSEGWSLVMQNGIPTWASTSPGTAHTLLGNALHSDVSGETAQNGDIIIRTGGTWGRLAKQNDNQYLVLQAGLPTWASTTNITELGTITTGIWNGTVINSAYIASSSIWNATTNLVNASSTNWDSAYSWGNHASANYIADADFSVNGVMVRTANGTYIARTATGTVNQIVVTNGDGVSGNPTFALDSDVYLGTSGKIGRDADNLLNFSTDNEIGFYTNGLLGMVLNASGYLSIGTSTSSNALTILSDATSQLRLAYDASNYVEFNVNATGDLSIISSSGGSTTIGNGVEAMQIDVYGNLLLGTSTAYGILTIASTTSGSVLFVIDVHGNVGIGTTTPSGMLTVGVASGSQFIVNSVGQVIAGEWLGSTIDIAHGGTGTSTPPTDGQLLMGNEAGEFEYVSTSSLGITQDSKSVFVGTTTVTSDGSFATSTLTGYKAANNICSTEFTGAHLCRTYDIILTIEQGDISNWTSGSAWVSQGPNTANDCGGWKNADETELGSFWSFDSDSGGEGWLTNCSVQKPLACCAWQ